MNTRIPPGRGHPPAKEPPTGRTEEGGSGVTQTQPRTYLAIQLNSGEITHNKQLNKSTRKASKPYTHGRASSNTACPHLHNRKQEVVDRLTLS